MADHLNLPEPDNHVKLNVTMQSKNDTREGLMLLVSRMQALVRGTLMRRSLMKLRAEFEEINEELEGGVSNRVSTDWPAYTPCRPTFKSAKEDSDVLQRLAKQGWRKPQLSQHSEQSVSTASDQASPQYSSDFQSRSSLSSEASVRPSPRSLSLQSSSGAQGDHHDEQKQLEYTIINSEGSTDVQSPVTSAKETKETTDQMVLEITREKREHHEENSGDPKSMPSTKSEGVSGSREEIMRAEEFEARAASRRGSEDDEGCDPVTGGRHSGKMIIHRQSLNETDFTVVSSIEASSVCLSCSDDESVSANAVDKAIPNTHILEKLDQGQGELGMLHQALNDHKGLSASNPHNGTSAAAGDGRTEMDDRHEFDRNGQQEHIRLRSPVGQEESQQSSLPSSKANSSDIVPIFSQSPNSEEQDLQHLPTDREIPPENNGLASTIQGNRAKSKESKPVVNCERKAMICKESMTTSLGAVGMDLDQSRQDSMRNDYPLNDHDTSLAADMTSIWSTDLSIIHNEQAPQRDEAQLREIRNNTAMELLWIQQAIESRKNYLKLKSKMGCSERTDH